MTVTAPPTWNPRTCSPLNILWSLQKAESLAAQQQPLLSSFQKVSIFLSLSPFLPFFFFFAFFETVSHIAYIQIYYKVKDGHELLIFLFLVPKYGDYRCMPSYPVYAVLRIKHRTLYEQDKHSDN